jgi:uridine kinase
MKRVLISICGGSGCGKSMLAKLLVERLGPDRTVRIPTDFYLQSNPYSSLTEFYQHPLQYDWNLLKTALREPDGASITSPSYDFIHFQRISITGGRPFTLRLIILLDSMVPYPGADFTIFIHCADNERRRRIIERDRQWKTRVIDYWALHQLTLVDMLNSHPEIDLALDGSATSEENAGKILALLLRKGKINVDLSNPLPADPPETTP